MRQTYFTLLLFFFATILWGKPVNITVSGFVFDESTGMHAGGQLITIKARNINPPFVYFEKLVTDSYGYFSKSIEFPYSKGIIEVSTFDCNGQCITHLLTFSLNQTNLTTCFVICYDPQLTYCHADFLYLPDRKEPGTMHFRDASLGEIQSWHWNFGDGNYSDKPNPVHKYSNDGNYDVCLTIGGNSGTCTDVFCKGVTVKNDTICTAMFTYSENYGMPNTIHFWDLSQGNISNWQWDFGDGTTSVNQNPIHSYAGQGSYEVCLTISNPTGNCSDTYCAEVITGSFPGCKAMFFAFNDSLNQLSRKFVDVSYGEPTSWQWSFGDSTYSTEQNPVHNYSQEGIYNVCLAIYNDNTGCSDTYYQTIIIYQQLPCTAYFNYLEISTQPYTYQFADLSVGDVGSWKWDFGDGKSSIIHNPIHTYYQNGEYEVCLTITNTQGTCADTYCETIYVGTTPNCTANFVYQQDGINPLTFLFTDISSGVADTWQWDFGDGTISAEQNPTHTFSEEGYYLICLDISNSSGQCQDQYCTGIVVTGLYPCQADFDFLIIPEDPLSVQFTDISTGNIGFWYWDFGDGNMSFGQNPLHTYESKGVYEVCLHVMDFNYQCTDQICKNVEITYDPTCEAYFTFEPLANDPFTYQFTDSSSGNIVDWLWSFGDGSTSTLQNPEHTFAVEGSFEICLTITNQWGNCQDVFCTDVIIDIPELCSADFDFNINPEQPFTVGFTDFSSGIMTQWLWDFGDGSTAEVQNPVHVYADTGAYQVNLLIQNPDSLIYCFHSITKQVPVYVSVPECHANFVAVPDSGVNKPNLFHFYDSSTGEPDAWLWNFGDGSTSTLQNPDHKFDDFGDYEVSLSITTQNPWGDDCTDTKILQFSSPDYYHFGGLVYAGDYPINNPVNNGDTAQVFVYRHQNNSVCPIDTNQFTSLGYFYFLYLLPSNYLIKVKLTQGSTNASGYFPSYYGDNLNWQDASVLQLIDSCQYHANINLIGMNETENGIGKITGSVVHHIEKFYAATPAENTEILLFDAALNPVKYCYSNGNGDFEFNDLSLGTYILQAESTGLFTEAVSVTLSESSPVANGLQLDLFNTDITTTNQISGQGIVMAISPNPVKDEFYLNIRFPHDKIIRLTILGVTGNKIWSDVESIRTGDNSLPIKPGNLSKGLYFLNVITDDGTINETLKFIK